MQVLSLLSPMKDLIEAAIQDAQFVKTIYYGASTWSCREHEVCDVKAHIRVIADRIRRRMLGLRDFRNTGEKEIKDTGLIILDRKEHLGRVMRVYVLDPSVT